MDEHVWIEVTDSSSLPDRVWMCNRHPGEMRRQRPGEADPEQPTSCGDCGALVANKTAHRAWHEGLGPEIDRRILSLRHRQGRPVAY